MDALRLDAKKTALILIDLQQAIVARTLAPHAATDVVRRSAALAAAFRGKGAMVVYVRVDLANMLALPVDAPSREPHAPLPPTNASEVVPEAGMQARDVLITKRQWGAFFGTELERLLRERGIETVVIGGIATNFGVESTARASAGLGFSTVLVEDAMTSLSAEAHRFAVETIFPRLGRVRSAEQVMAGLIE